MSEYDELRWTLRTKVSKAMHDEIMEVANRKTGGNISKLIRETVKIGLKFYRENEDESTFSVELRQILYEQDYKRHQEIKMILQKMYLNLQTNPNETGKAIALELSEKHDLPWPPKTVSPSDANPDLHRILHRLKSLWQRNENAGTVTLRELNRSLTAYDAEQLRGHLNRLENLGEVTLVGSRMEGGSLKIAPVERF